MSNAKCDHIIREVHDIHKDHDDHKHGADCGHTAIVHTDSHGCEHIDYVHKDEAGEPHLHHACENGSDHVHECSLEDAPKLVDGLVSEDACILFNNCATNHPDGVCGTDDCNHEAVLHDGHKDYLVPDVVYVPDGNGDYDEVEGFQVHCPHGDHCDERGFVPKAPSAPTPAP